MNTAWEKALYHAVKIRLRKQSMNALCKAAGVPQPSLYRWYKGTRGLNFETAAKVAAYLGVLQGEEHDG